MRNKMGIVVGVITGNVVGVGASAAGADYWLSAVITVIVAGCAVAVWDAATDWRGYDR